jgi:hypothetical protein
MDTRLEKGTLRNAVAIVGKGRSRCHIPAYQKAGLREVWTLNDDYQPGITTRHFDIHTPIKCGGEYAAPFMVRDEKYLGQDANAERYPMEEVAEFYGWEKGAEYLATTPAYMLALAIMWHKWDTVLFPGIDFYWQHRAESLWERPCVEWYMGFARAVGIKLMVPDESSLLTAEEGISRRPYGSGVMRRAGVAGAGGKSIFRSAKK